MALDGEEFTEEDCADRSDTLGVVSTWNDTLVDENLLGLHKVEHGVLGDVRVLQEANVNLVFLLSKLDPRSTIGGKGVESQAMMLASDDKIGFARDCQDLGKLGKAL